MSYVTHTLALESGSVRINADGSIDLDDSPTTLSTEEAYDLYRFLGSCLPLLPEQP